MLLPYNTAKKDTVNLEVSRRRYSYGAKQPMSSVYSLVSFQFLASPLIQTGGLFDPNPGNILIALRTVQSFGYDGFRGFRRCAASSFDGTKFQADSKRKQHGRGWMSMFFVVEI